MQDTISSPNVNQRRAIAESILGSIDWLDSQTGLCQCPGEHHHKAHTGKRDCRVCLDGIPTIFCFHDRCSDVIARANHDLRSAISKGELDPNAKPKRRKLTAEEKKKQEQRGEAKKLKARFSVSLDAILRENVTSPADYFEASPVRLLDDPRDDWRRMLRLFKGDDVIWIGEPKSSCNVERPKDTNPDYWQRRQMEHRKFFRPYRNG